MLHLKESLNLWSVLTLDNRAHVFSFTPEDRDYKIKLQEKGIENSDGMSCLAVEYTLPQKLIDFS